VFKWVFFWFSCFDSFLSLIFKFGFFLLFNHLHCDINRCLFNHWRFFFFIFWLVSINRCFFTIFWRNVSVIKLEKLHAVFEHFKYVLSIVFVLDVTLQPNLLCIELSYPCEYWISCLWINILTVAISSIIEAVWVKLSFVLEELSFRQVQYTPKLQRINPTHLIHGVKPESFSKVIDDFVNKAFFLLDMLYILLLSTILFVMFQCFRYFIHVYALLLFLHCLLALIMLNFLLEVIPFAFFVIIWVCIKLLDSLSTFYKLILHGCFIEETISAF